LDEPLRAGADVAPGAADAGVRRALEGRVLRLHDLVAGHAAELCRIHVVHGLEHQARCDRQHRNGQCHERNEYAAGAFLVQVEHGQVTDVLALRCEPRVLALAPPHAEWHDDDAEQESHRQHDESEDAEVGTSFETHALHDQQRNDEQQAHHGRQGADQAHDVAGHRCEEMLDHR
jgi:hypothetical protein